MTVSPLPPTARLPPIHALASTPLPALLDALAYLHRLYIPEVRGSRRTHPHGATPASALALLRSDPFERTHALRWLTALIALSDGPSGAPERLIESAAALLAACAGPAAAGTLTRAFALGRGVRVQLTDAPLANGDFGSVGAQTWGGACVLADLLVDAPARFGLAHEGGRGRLRVLELGAGTGLVSIALGKLLQSAPGLAGADILATDNHPAVLANLRRNIAANFPAADTPDSAPDSRVTVSAQHLDWTAPPPHAPYDLVLGADIVYEAAHVGWVRACVGVLLAPRAGAQFHLVVPLRPTHAAECDALERVFPRLGEACAAEDGAVGEPVLGIARKEVIVCDAEEDGGLGTGKKVEYAYYTIEWGL